MKNMHLNYKLNQFCSRKVKGGKGWSFVESNGLSRYIDPRDSPTSPAKSNTIRPEKPFGKKKHSRNCSASFIPRPLLLLKS